MNELMTGRIGAYRIRREETREITEQGPVVVYEAEDRAGWVVALRVLPSPANAEEEQRALAMETAVRAVAALTRPPRTHAHVLRIYDIALSADTPQGRKPYLVTEFLNSPTLREHLDRKGPLSLQEASDFLTQIASAVDAIHAAGVVHGAIHSGTIRFDKRDRHIIKLVGIENAVPIGTERNGSVARPEEDYQALAPLLYEMVTGRPASVGEIPVIPGTSETVAELNALLQQPFSAALELAVAVRAAMPVEGEADTRVSALQEANASVPVSTGLRIAGSLNGKILLVSIGLIVLAAGALFSMASGRLSSDSNISRHREIDNTRPVYSPASPVSLPVGDTPNSQVTNPDTQRGVNGDLTFRR
jgi:hypothetical protein